MVFFFPISRLGTKHTIDHQIFTVLEFSFQNYWCPIPSAFPSRKPLTALSDILEIHGSSSCPTITIGNYLLFPKHWRIPFIWMTGMPIRWIPRIHIWLCDLDRRINMVHYYTLNLSGYWQASKPYWCISLGTSFCQLTDPM